MENNKNMDVKSSIWAGLIGALALLMMDMILIALFTDSSIWGPPRMIAAIVMGESVLEPVTFNAKIIGVSLLVHGALSIIYTIVLGYFIHQKGMTFSIVAGLVYGLLLYLINFYGFTTIFPWFEMARGWISIVAHLSFGLAAGYAYQKIVESQHKVEVAHH